MNVRARFCGHRQCRGVFVPLIFPLSSSCWSLVFDAFFSTTSFFFTLHARTATARLSFIYLHFLLINYDLFVQAICDTPVQPGGYSFFLFSLRLVGL